MKCLFLQKGGMICSFMTQRIGLRSDGMLIHYLT